MAYFQKRVVAPTVNLNGTAPGNLIGDLMNCKVRIDHAIEAMKAAMPHGRDYVDEEQYSSARLAWQERVRIFDVASTEIETLAIQIRNQTSE